MATVHLFELDKNRYNSHITPACSHINVGTGVDCTIRNLAETMAKLAEITTEVAEIMAEVAETTADVVGFSRKIVFDASKPDGTFRKLLDVSKIGKLGREASISLGEGLETTYNWYLKNIAETRNAG